MMITRPASGAAARAVARRTGELVQTTLPKGGRILEDARDGAAVQAGDARSVHQPSCAPGSTSRSAVTQFVTTLVRAHDTLPVPDLLPILSPSLSVVPRKVEARSCSRRNLLTLEAAYAAGAR
jgi:hypothetical protein